MDLDEFLEKIEALTEAGGGPLRGFTGDSEEALTLARIGFVVVGDLQSQPRKLSVDELEYIVAREKGHVQ